MSDLIPIQLIVAAFQNEDGADEAWKKLQVAKWGGLIKIDRLAIIRRTEKDKIKIKEQGDPGGSKGAVVGAIVGSILGSIAGPIGAVVVGGATGALVGGVTAKYYDSGIPDSRLKEIGDVLQPGTSAIVVVVEHKWVREFQKDLQEAGAHVLTETLKEDVAKQLAEGKEMNFTAIGGEEDVTVTRMTGDEKEVKAQAETAAAEGGATIAGAGVITSGDEGDSESTEGAGVITSGDEGDSGDGEGTEGAGVITQDKG